MMYAARPSSRFPLENEYSGWSWGLGLVRGRRRRVGGTKEYIRNMSDQPLENEYSG